MHVAFNLSVSNFSVHHGNASDASLPRTRSEEFTAVCSAWTRGRLSFKECQPCRSGRSSRITAVVHACTASVPVCVPVPVALLWQHAAARPCPPVRLSKRTPISVLPQSNKLRSSRDFTVTVRRGRRIGRKTLVLHIRDTAASGGGDKTDTQIARFGGPRVGLVVSKAVGNAVTRHAVSRKLRHVMARPRRISRPL